MKKIITFSITLFTLLLLSYLTTPSTYASHCEAGDVDEEGNYTGIIYRYCDGNEVWRDRRDCGHERVKRCGNNQTCEDGACVDVEEVCDANDDYPECGGCGLPNDHLTQVKRNTDTSCQYQCEDLGRVAGQCSVPDGENVCDSEEYTEFAGCDANVCGKEVWKCPRTGDTKLVTSPSNGDCRDRGINPACNDDGEETPACPPGQSNIKKCINRSCRQSSECGTQSECSQDSECAPPGPTCSNKTCIYSQSENSCFVGHCLNGSEDCSFNFNCGYVPGCANAGQEVSCQVIDAGVIRGGGNAIDPTPATCDDPPSEFCDTSLNDGDGRIVRKYNGRLATPEEKNSGVADNKGCVWTYEPIGRCDDGRQCDPKKLDPFTWAFSPGPYNKLTCNPTNNGFLSQKWECRNQDEYIDIIADNRCGTSAPPISDATKAQEYIKNQWNLSMVAQFQQPRDQWDLKHLTWITNRFKQYNNNFTSLVNGEIVDLCDNCTPNQMKTRIEMGQKDVTGAEACGRCGSDEMRFMTVFTHELGHWIAWNKLSLSQRTRHQATYKQAGGFNPYGQVSESENYAEMISFCLNGKAVSRGGDTSQYFLNKWFSFYEPIAKDILGSCPYVFGTPNRPS